MRKLQTKMRHQTCLFLKEVTKEYKNMAMASKTTIKQYTNEQLFFSPRSIIFLSIISSSNNCLQEAEGHRALN